MKYLKSFLVFSLCVGVVFMSTPQVFADETSELILKLLVRKGIVTQQEIDELKAELAKGKPTPPEGLEERVARLEKDLPKWVKNTNWKGDLRLRNEYIANDQGQDNNRQRIRFRYGATTEPVDKVKIGFGLASGSSDTPTSTNQTLESEFQSKQIWLDYAYAEYEPYEWLTLMGGKFKSPFFHTDMLWDSDIRFDGFAGKLTGELFGNNEGSNPTKVYLTAGVFPIDDANTSEGDDIYLYAAQVGTVSKFGSDKFAKLETGVAYYDFDNLQGATAASLAEERGTNTYDGTYASGSTAATVRHDFQVISPTVKLSFKDIFGRIDVPWGLLGEYANNLDPSNHESAWRGGAWLGKSKVKKNGDWKLIGMYSRLEKDAFFDSFPDADFNNGGTDGKGFEFIFDYGLADNVIFSVDYYNTEKISASDSDQQIVQADLIFKF